MNAWAIIGIIALVVAAVVVVVGVTLIVVYLQFAKGMRW